MSGCVTRATISDPWDAAHPMRAKSDRKINGVERSPL
jgi:hypothetical protein